MEDTHKFGDNMNNIDKEYQVLLQDILDNGVVKSDRTGTGTISVFGRQIRHKMREGFPLLTTKKVHWNSIVTELLWFLRGDTNIKFLLDNDCHIWDGDAYKNWCKQFEVDPNNFDAEELVKGYNDQCWGYPILDHVKPTSKEYKRGQINAYLEDKADKPFFYFTKEEFINKIKTNNEFAKNWGDLGPIYGKQWRQWQGWMDMNGNQKGSLWYDQILRLVHDLKTNPDSRRLMVSAWNVAELDQMVLPPCHYGFQVYTRELSTQERYVIARSQSAKYKCPMWKEFDFDIDTNGNLIPKKNFHTQDEHYDNHRIPTRAISLMWNQRSVDTFLGLPFNIASYALLLEIIAKEVNMIPDELIGNLGDVHLYSNHIEQAKEQIERTPYNLPKLRITERDWYQHELVKEHLGPKTFSEKILSYRPDCFELIGYESHSGIKAPFSN
jgi:thymidylate synthase